jgi:hypothetical protein
METLFFYPTRWKDPEGQKLSFLIYFELFLKVRKLFGKILCLYKIYANGSQLVFTWQLLEYIVQIPALPSQVIATTLRQSTSEQATEGSLLPTTPTVTRPVCHCGSLRCLWRRSSLTREIMFKFTFWRIPFQITLNSQTLSRKITTSVVRNSFIIKVYMFRHVFFPININFFFGLQKMTILPQRTKRNAYDYLIYSVCNLNKINLILWIYLFI